MSNMNGNPHAQPAINRRGQIISEFGEGNGNSVPNTLALAQLEATLALVYEQRTANLIALMAIGVTDMSGWPAEFVEVNVKRNEIIKARLGLNEGATK